MQDDTQSTHWGRWLAVTLGAAVGAYGAYVAATWWRYGRATGPRDAGEADPLLDRFMPVYDVREWHATRVDAPPDVVLAAARAVDLTRPLLARAIFKTREIVLGGHPTEAGPIALADLVGRFGWGVLANDPDREVVLGAATRPWEADPRFVPIAPGGFAAFAEPDLVKIVWTLRADPIGPSMSRFSTETRVATTDAGARAKFRRYWAAFSPGIRLIRRAVLPLVKAEAEQRARTSAAMEHAVEADRAAAAHEQEQEHEAEGDRDFPLVLDRQAAARGVLGEVGDRHLPARKKRRPARKQPRDEQRPENGLDQPRRTKK